VWFFRLLLIFTIVVVVLLIVLKINETVSFKDGKIVAANPQADYIAPVESQVIKIAIREGQKVHKGDTLLLLQNPDLLQQLEKTKTETQFLQSKIARGERGSGLRDADYEKQLISLQQLLKKLEIDASRLTVIASSDGIVNYVFNTEKTTNFIDKGEILVSVAPPSDTYYARITIAEKDIPTVKKGMPVRLHFDAFKNRNTGSIDGKVAYVSERKQDDNFFAIVDLKNTANIQLRSGYTIYGEIILDRLPLYKYIVRKLFANE
jgi:multidrug resistance efflux pump